MRADDAKVARPEVLDRATIQVLLDDRGADVRRPRDGRRIPESFANASHDRRDDSLRFGVAARNVPFGERDCRRQRAAPGSEILGREVVAEMLADVLVKGAAGEVGEAVFDAISEQPRAAGKLDERANGVGELGVDEGATDLSAPFAGEPEADLIAPDLDVPLAESRDAIRARLAGVAVRPRPQPREVDDAKSDRARPFRFQRLQLHVLAHHSSQIGKAVREADQPVVFRLLLLRPIFRVIEVLSPAGAVDARRLELRVRPRRDPDVAPRRRYSKLLDSRELRRIRDPVSPGVVVAETTARPPARPASSTRHRACISDSDRR